MFDADKLVNFNCDEQPRSSIRLSVCHSTLPPSLSTSTTVSQTYSKRAWSNIPRPPTKLQRWTQRRQPLWVGEHHPWTSWICLRRWSFLPWHPLLHRLPIQTSQSQVPYSHLPLQRQLPGSDLLGHPEGQVEPGPVHLQGLALHLLLAVRLQPQWSPGQQHCYPVRQQQVKIRRFKYILGNKLNSLKVAKSKDENVVNVGEGEDDVGGCDGAAEFGVRVVVKEVMKVLRLLSMLLVFCQYFIVRLTVLYNLQIGRLRNTQNW